MFVSVSVLVVDFCQVTGQQRPGFTFTFLSHDMFVSTAGEDIFVDQEEPSFRKRRSTEILINRCMYIYNGCLLSVSFFRAFFSTGTFRDRFIGLCAFNA